MIVDLQQHQTKQALDQIKDRHSDILKLENSIEELCDVFRNVEMLVGMQVNVMKFFTDAKSWALIGTAGSCPIFFIQCVIF